jgi:hypothetical protein
LSICTGCASHPAANSPVLNPDDFKHYVDALNAGDPRDFNGGIFDFETFDWMKQNIPFFSCPDKDVETTYYYRWWAYRKHLEQVPNYGWVITEFLRPVSHATQYNAISCALGLHIAEGRWLHDPKYLDGDVKFWFHGGQNKGLQTYYHNFSNWTASALYDRWLVDGNTTWLVAQLDSLVADYQLWEKEKLTDNGLFWQRDVADGMEESASGGRKVKNVRPTINSYMYANALAISKIAALAGKNDLRDQYQQKADALKKLTDEKLWNPDARFYETVLQAGGFANVREEIDFEPWYFNLPPTGQGREIAWKQLSDPKGFFAPFGPTTAEQRSPLFAIADKGYDTQWNGPSWPFATSLTLGALANVLNNYPQDSVTKSDYWQTFQIYTHDQRLKLDDGTVVPFVDEDQNPLTGVWWARELKIRKKTYYGRGDHYNHSSYADLVITGVVGLRPRADNVVEVNPLIPDGTWDWFALDNIPYHGHTLAIVWDRSGDHFHRQSGLTVYSDGKEIAHSDTLERITGNL